MNANTDDLSHARASQLAEHFWFGRWLSAASLPEALQDLSTHLDATLAQRFPLAALLQACEQVALQLSERRGCHAQLLAEACLTCAPEDADAMLQAMAAMLQRDAMEEKLRSELGNAMPGTLLRRYPGHQYETWAPYGCVVHIAPANVFTAAAMGLVEGLMAGNVNIVKTSSRDGRVAAMFAQALAHSDASGRLADYMAVLRLPSGDQALLQQLLGFADVVSIWGGEKAVAAVRAMAPAHARMVTWGHKLSFGYIAAACVDDDAVLEACARDVCRLDQQACSSPQTLLVETDEQGLHSVAQRLAAQLRQVSPTIPAAAPDMAEQAEITTVVSVARSEQALGLTQVIEDEQGRWRILQDLRPGLRPSPLYRSIWLKPVQRQQLAAQLRPMRQWLQTCGLAADLASTAELTRLLLSAGVSRITRPGEMVDSYIGAPHDGVYALQQLARRVSVDAGPALATVGNMDELAPPLAEKPAAVAILDKTGFQALGQSDPKAGLIVRSGGSSGQIAYSSFRWADYHTQMAATADGMVAAGLEPATDRVMNLFAAGYMYGSFISFWTILEHLKVLQLPMTMVAEYELIADQVIEHRANTLVGAVPHMLALFTAQRDRLRGKIQKVFYGGEPMSSAQLQFLQQDCGVQLVRSAAYGSNDAGPMGYQCQHSTGTVHHVHSRLQMLEIVEMDSDQPVQGDAVGRLLLSSKARSQPRVERYEIGDIGRWIPGPCGCGRLEPRFELLGRLGDVFKVGPPMSYSFFANWLSEQGQYAGPVQIHLRNQGLDTLFEIWVNPLWNPEKTASAVATLVQDYGPLHWCAANGVPVLLQIQVHEDAEFVRNRVSGKLRNVCDHRVEQKTSAAEETA